MKEKKEFIYYVKFLAVLLVLNSHLDKLYPISILATGGAIGNCLFFLVSGYTWANIGERKFYNWFCGKIKRLWLPTIFTNILFLLLLYNKEITLLSILQIFIYPNKSWFCGAILLYSFFYYFIVKKEKLRKPIIMLTLLTYILFYIFFIDKTAYNVESFNVLNLCRICFYFSCMCVGYLYKIKNNYNQSSCTKNFIKILLLIICLYSFKFAMSKYNFLYQFQFIDQLLSFLCSLQIFNFLCISNSKLKSSRIIRTISNYSWEVYLTQTLIIPFCTKIFFPINIAIVILLITISSIVLKKLVEQINKLLEYSSNNKEKETS